MQIDTLTRALDAVHAAILAGRIDDLGPLTETITETSANLTAATEPQIRLIQNLAARNAICLQSAMKGIRAAQRRVAELRAASTGHATYDRNGARASLGGADGTLRQRM
ncbi:MAG: hypothetical protein ACRCSU_03130 [Paracoccaceae bacterium]